MIDPSEHWVLAVGVLAVVALAVRWLFVLRREWRLRRYLRARHGDLSIHYGDKAWPPMPKPFPSAPEPPKRAV